jgi:hypothetical protein
MLQRLGRARSYSWIGAVADCAMRKAFGAASERDEVNEEAEHQPKWDPFDSSRITLRISDAPQTIHFRHFIHFALAAFGC